MIILNKAYPRDKFISCEKVVMNTNYQPVKTRPPTIPPRKIAPTPPPSLTGQKFCVCKATFDQETQYGDIQCELCQQVTIRSIHSFSSQSASHSMPPASARCLQNCSPVVPATRNTTPRAQLASATATMERTVSSRRLGLESSTGALAMSARHGSMKTAFQKRFVCPIKICLTVFRTPSWECKITKSVTCVRNAQTRISRSSTAQWRFRSSNSPSRFTPSSKTRDTPGLSNAKISSVELKIVSDLHLSFPQPLFFI